MGFISVQENFVTDDLQEALSLLELSHEQETQPAAEEPSIEEANNGIVKLQCATALRHLLHPLRPVPAYRVISFASILKTLSLPVFRHKQVRDKPYMIWLAGDCPIRNIQSACSYLWWKFRALAGPQNCSQIMRSLLPSMSPG